MNPRNPPAPCVAQMWPIRVLRAFAASALSVLIAVGGHLLAGGTVALPGLLVGTWMLVLGIAFLVGRQRVTTGQIIGLLLIGQLAIHIACMAGTESMAMGPPMLLGHLLATVLAAVVLRRGEDLLWSLAERLGLHGMRHLLETAEPVQAKLAVARGGVPPISPRNFLDGGVGLRGPPVGCS